MHRRGHILVTLRLGERCAHVPCHVDYLVGACRHAGRLDGGPIDRVLHRWGGGFRALCVHHARRSLGKVGEHHVGYDAVEELLGLSRTYRVQIAAPERVRDVVQALRDVRHVETSIAQTLATVPFAAAASALPEDARQIREAWVPHARIHAPEALEIEPGDERTTVAVVDTGVALGHPELRRKLLAGYDTVDLGLGALNEEVRLIGDSRGADFTPQDEVGHGSHCAGAIGAQGYRLPRGVGGRSLVLPIRALAAAARLTGRRMGVGSLCDIDVALKLAVDLGADVINMSLGTPESAVDPRGPRPHAEVVRYADHYGCVLIAATGNSGKEERFYPAALPEVLAIGSVDAHGRRSRFSTYGGHVALCAPGEDIISIGRRGYRRSSGTSHAAPLVSGAAALLVSRARQKGHALSGAEVRRILIASAAPLGDGRPNPHTGHGMLDVRAALRHLDRALEGRQADGRSG